VLDVNYVLVLLCAWWLVAIDEFYTCAILLMIIYDDAHLLTMKYYVYSILLIFSIMIDVKLTPIGLWWTTYLFVWMGRRRAGLVDSLCLVSCWRVAGASSVYFAFRVLERLWSRTTFILCFGFYLLLRYTLCWDLLLFGCIPWVWWHDYIIEVYVIFRCDVLCWDILCMSSWWIIRRRDVYFLIIYYNCVIYRLFRNRALQRLKGNEPKPPRE